MKIDKLYLRNFRGISDAEIELNGKSTVIYGINGMGKTTILDACNIIFSKILHEVTDDIQIDVYMIKEKDVKLGENLTKIEIHILDNDKTFVYWRMRRGEKNTHKEEQLRNIADHLRKQYIDQYTAEEEDEEVSDDTDWETFIGVNDRNMPIYVSYGINRYIEDNRLFRKKNIGSAGKLDAWRDDALGGIINFSLFFTWFRSRQEYENSIKVEDSSFEDTQLKSTRTAILTALGEDFSSIKIKIADDETDMMLVKKERELNVRQLSEGEKSMIALVGDLARRLAIANPRETDPLQGQGIVLIDEIDLHLHPSWQARVLPTLLKIFPNIQFIVTTHAPKVLGEMGDEVNVIHLEENDGEIIVEQIKPLNGWDVNAILEKYMGTSPLHFETSRMIDEMYEHIHLGEYDKAEEIVDRLECMTDANNPEVVKGKVLIARRR